MRKGETPLHKRLDRGVRAGASLTDEAKAALIRGIRLAMLQDGTLKPRETRRYSHQKWVKSRQKRRVFSIKTA